jgi:hypothetical protein
MEPSTRGGVAPVEGSWFMSHSDPDHWRKRADEVLAQAAGMRDEWARWTLLQIAVGYDHLAKRAQEERAEVGTEQSHQ